jgi:hypothetical protein
MFPRGGGLQLTHDTACDDVCRIALPAGMSTHFDRCGTKLVNRRGADRLGLFPSELPERRSLKLSTAPDAAHNAARAENGRVWAVRKWEIPATLSHRNRRCYQLVLSWFGPITLTPSQKTISGR